LYEATMREWYDGTGRDDSLSFKTAGI